MHPSLLGLSQDVWFDGCGVTHEKWIHAMPEIHPGIHDPSHGLLPGLGLCSRVYIPCSFHNFSLAPTHLNSLLLSIKSFSLFNAPVFFSSCSWIFPCSMLLFRIFFSSMLLIRIVCTICSRIPVCPLHAPFPVSGPAPWSSTQKGVYSLLWDCP